MGSGWANPRAPWLRGHPSLRITALSKLGCAWNKPTRGIYSTLSHRHPRAPWHKVTPLLWMQKTYQNPYFAPLKLKGDAWGTCPLLVLLVMPLLTAFVIYHNDAAYWTGKFDEKHRVHNQLNGVKKKKKKKKKTLYKDKPLIQLCFPG